MRYAALSPHIDDLAFSLGGALKLGHFEAIRPISVFTISDYVLCGAGGDPVLVSGIRKKEDANYFGAIRSAERPIWLDFLDAPIRRSISAESTCGTELNAEDVRLLDDIVERMRGLLYDADVLLAPLGIGEHVDHTVVHLLALRLQELGHVVYFYEDLPYAAECSEEDIRHRIARIASQSNVALRSLVVNCPDLPASKQRVCDIYSSQSNQDLFSKLIVHSRRVNAKSGFGERIWVC